MPKRFPKMDVLEVLELVENGECCLKTAVSLVWYKHNFEVSLDYDKEPEIQHRVKQWYQAAMERHPATMTMAHAVLGPMLAERCMEQLTESAMAELSN